METKMDDVANNMSRLETENKILWDAVGEKLNQGIMLVHDLLFCLRSQ